MAKIKLLFIDDDPNLLKMYKIALQSGDFEVFEAEDGVQGLKVFKEAKPDVIVVDIAMPGIDGYEVIQAIRTTPGPESKTPIIILTAHEQHVMRDYAQEVGADLYLTKPITPAKLIEKMKELHREKSRLEE